VRRRTGLLLALLWVGVSAPAAAEPVPQREAVTEDVVLLHGLGRSSRAMRSLETRLAQAGYAVHNLSYPSTELPPEELDVYLHAQVVACCWDAGRLHFVTHSLGGILVRAYLARHEPQQLGRVVMLAPPNAGSEWVDRFGDSAAFRWVLGPTAIQLGTDADSLPRRLPPPDYELGVIAGTRRLNPLGIWVVPGESDGTVSVENARLEGMSDFVALPYSHSRILRSDAAGMQVLEFLRNGRFAH
jgi:triacylglycerol lipase